MIVSVLQENLAKALSVATRAVDGNPPLPILGNVLLETEDSRLKISATNLETSISIWIGAKVENPGSITVHAKTFQEIMKTLSPERIDFVLDESTHTLNFRCGIQSGNVRGISSQEFPPINHNEEAHIQVNGEVFRESILQTSFAVAREQIRPVLTGVYIKIEGSKLTLACADGYRLSVRDFNIGEQPGEIPESDAILPARAINTVRAMTSDNDEIGISFPSQRNSMTFFAPNIALSTQLIEGRFPDFATIIPRSFRTESVMYRDDLLKVSERAYIFSKDDANKASLMIKPSLRAGEPAEVVVAGRSIERGDSEGILDATATGEPVDVSFNVSYLIDLLRVVKEERVCMGFNGPENAAVVRPENRDDFVHVIMPMSR